MSPSYYHVKLLSIFNIVQVIIYFVLANFAVPDTFNCSDSKSNNSADYLLKILCKLVQQFFEIFC